MEIKKGIAVSPGVVISTAVVLDAEDLAVPKRHIEEKDVIHEVQRFKDALEHSIAELEGLRGSMEQKYGKDIGNILNFHIAVLRDKTLINPVTKMVQDQKVTAEYAVAAIMRKYAANFQAMPDRYLSERVKDIHDIERRILHGLIGEKEESLHHLTDDVVVIAHDLLPSQTAALEPTSAAAPLTPPSSPGPWESRPSSAWATSPPKSPAATPSSSMAIAAW